jgi:2-polyprenyl-3-methyl-5-hydroxy-6-metoxy-1,4-benzoquinol methylase
MQCENGSRINLNSAHVSSRSLRDGFAPRHIHGLALPVLEVAVKLPPEASDPDWQRLRQHDLEELWDTGRAPHVAAAYAARLRLLEDLIQRADPVPARVLDVGCAQGTLGLMLAEKGYEVSLVDPRRAHIEYAKARRERGNVKFYKGYLGPTCPPEQDFDLVVCTEVLEHVRTPGSLLEALASRARRGGHVVLTTPNAEYVRSGLPSYGQASQRVIDEAEADSADGDAHRYLFTREELLSLVRGVGLQIVEHGFFLPLWLEGHMKTRLAHQALHRLRGRPVDCTGRLQGPLARYLCTSQWVLARPGERILDPSLTAWKARV